MNLYLKYRPKTIDELDLESVRKTLSDIVRANKTSHAYLLTGPRGSGKTSTARILARIVNCEKNGSKLGEPCNKCSACKSILEGSALDVIEIDAASNRGIDDIRELKEKIRLAPVTLSKKVYIIDEVHMLTTEAFNALLKTLEEPPKHSLFILCTTETHKVPETIVSRCARIAFTKATSKEMVRSFTRVVKGEGVKAEDEALLYLGNAVDGSFRDGVKVLDQIISSHTGLTMASVQEVLEGVSGYTAIPFATALVERDGVKALEIFRASVDTGVEMTFLLTSTMRVLRDGLLSVYGVTQNPLKVVVDAETTKLVFMIDDVGRKLALTNVPELLVEMMIIEWCGENGGSKGVPPTPIDKIVKTEAAKPVEVKQKIEKKTEEQSSIAMDHKELWKQLMGNLDEESFTLGALLSKAGPAKIHGDELTIEVRYGFHKDQLMSEKILTKLEAMVSKIVGKPMRVRCEVVANLIPPLVPEDPGDDTIAEAVAIFTS